MTVDRQPPIWRYLLTSASGWLFVYGALNAPFIAVAVLHNVAAPPDWLIWAALDPANPYAVGRFRWSPVAAWIMAGVVLLGPLLWAVLHFVVLLLLRDMRLVVMILLSFGFWTDVMAGNAFIFFLIAAMMAMRGSSTAALLFCAMSVMVPRPVQLPVMLWLFWQRPKLRLPFLAVFAAHLALVLVIGGGEEWLARLATTSSYETSLPWPINWAPSLFIGPAWLAIGVPVGAWLLWKGRPGWAGLAWSPYWLPYYLMMPLVPHSERKT